MQNKFKNLKILVLAKYYFIGIILAVLVFQFVSLSLTNRTLDFYSLIASETLKLLFATIISALVVGLMYIAITKFGGNREYNDRRLWLDIKNKSIAGFRIVLMIAFSVGILVRINLDHIFDAEECNLIGQAVFSEENIIESISGVCAASVFGLILSAGVYKRLSLLFENEEK